MNFENFDPDDCSILIKVTKIGNLSEVHHVLSVLQQKGAESIISSLNTRDRQGYTALHHAVLLNHQDILTCLLQHADESCINMESHDRSTALLLACQLKQDRSAKALMVSSLLDAKADPNLPLCDPFALPLNTVLDEKWWAGAALLIHAGASVVATDFEHNNIPPIFMALNDEDTVRLMVERGALTSDCLWHGLNPLEYILESRFMYNDVLLVKLFCLFRKHCPQLVTPFARMQAVLQAADARQCRILVLLLSESSPDPHMLKELIMNYKFFQQQLKPDVTQRIYKSILGTLLRKEVVDESVLHKNLLLFMTRLDHPSAAFMMESFANRNLPVTCWKAPLQDFINYSVRVNTEVLCPYLASVTANAITVNMYFLAHNLTHAFPVLMELLAAGVEVQTAALYVIGRYREVWMDELPPQRRTENNHKLDVWDKYMNHLVFAWINSGHSMSDPDMINMCVHLLLHPCAVYTLLYHGVPAHRLLHFWFFTDTPTEPPKNWTEAGRQLLSYLVLARFVPRLPTDADLRLTVFRDDPRLAGLLRKVTEATGTLPSLRHLSRVAVRAALGCSAHPNIAILEDLKGIVPEQLQDYLIYKHEFAAFHFYVEDEE